MKIKKLVFIEGAKVNHQNAYPGFQTKKSKSKQQQRLVSMHSHKHLVSKKNNSILSKQQFDKKRASMLDHSNQLRALTPPDVDNRSGSRNVSARPTAQISKIALDFVEPQPATHRDKQPLQCNRTST